MTRFRGSALKGAGLRVGGLLLGMVALWVGLSGEAADHRDGPIFGPPGITIRSSRRDINDVYVFRSPATPANTVIIIDLSPFAGATTPNNFDQSLIYDIKVSNSNVGAGSDDLTYRITFSAPDPANGNRQQVTLRGLPATAFPAGGLLAKGFTNTNIDVRGGGLFRAGIQDDPFFFDATGFNQLLNGGAFPRPVGTATNFFGPNVNTLSLILEVPSTALAGPAGNLIGVWARTEANGVQVDRMGRPAINTALIPQIPRGSNFPLDPTKDRRNAFNVGIPSTDRTNFKADMVSVLTGFLGRSAADADAISGLLLPDLVVFELGNPNGFGTFIGPGGSFLGNGRRLRDDVIDFELTVLTNGGITTDNVGDDNGTRITDGNLGTVAAFPYIGPPNNPGTGVPGGSPPP